MSAKRMTKRELRIAVKRDVRLMKQKINELVDLMVMIAKKRAEDSSPTALENLVREFALLCIGNITLRVEQELEQL